MAQVRVRKHGKTFSYITLDGQIVYVSRKGYFFSTLKTQPSNRKILIDDFLIEGLQR